MSELPQQEDKPHRITPRLEEFFAAAALLAICVIALANVAVRYFTNASFAFTEEFSIFLMVVMTFFGASAAFARNRHIRVMFFVERLPGRWSRHLELLAMGVSAVMFATLAWYGTFLFWDDWQYQTTSPGIGIPQWIYTVWLPLLSAVIFLRICGRILRLLQTERRT